MQIELRYGITPGPIAVERRGGTSGSRHVISGYGAVFHRAGDRGTEYRLNEKTIERVFPGAFTEALADGAILATYNHSSDNILGRLGAKTLRLRQDNHGLAYEIDLPDTQLGRDLMVSMKRGDINTSSFGFLPVKATWAREGDMAVRELRAVRLFDVGPVSRAAYSGTSAQIMHLDADEPPKVRSTPRTPLPGSVLAEAMRERADINRDIVRARALAVEADALVIASRGREIDHAHRLEVAEARRELLDDLTRGWAKREPSRLDDAWERFSDEWWAARGKNRL